MAVPTNDMTNHLGALLKSFGVTSVEKGEGVRDLIERELKDRNLNGGVESLRYGKLTLSASSTEAQILRFDKDNILAALEKAYPGEVTSIIIKTRR